MTIPTRTESLTGPSREMDAEIALSQPDRFFDAGPRWEGQPHDIGKINVDGTRSLPGNGAWMLVPAYTASLDAAMTLASDDTALWTGFNVALCECSKRELPLREHLPRFLSAALIRARSLT